MRLILHIGSTKTGTTTIQQFFCRNHDALLAKGIFYPVKSSHTANHVLLTAGFVQQNKQLPHNSFYMSSEARFQKSFKAFWSQLLDGMEKYKPHTVVLSSETLFEDFSEVSYRSISSFLAESFDDIVVVAYVRSPASDYQSRIAQQVKTAKKLMPPHVRRIRSILEYYEKEFPKAVYVYPFESAQLKRRDVLYDFLMNHIPEAVTLMNESCHFKNIALPGWLLLQAQKLRLELQPSGQFPTITTNALINYLVEDYISSSRYKERISSMKLNAEIKEFIENSAVDYQWLKGRYNLEFADLDYSKIEEKENPYSDLFLLEDICVLENANDELCVDVSIPTSKFLRLFITLRFILKTQLTGFYKAKISYSWLGKIKRAVLKTA